MCDCVESVLKKRTDGRTEGRTVKVDSRDPPDPKTNSMSFSVIDYQIFCYIVRHYV